MDIRGRQPVKMTVVNLCARRLRQQAKIYEQQATAYGSP
jgi:hypothetical protein